VLIPLLAAASLLAGRDDVRPLLAKIAERAAAHRALLYRFACTERVDLLFQPDGGGPPTLSRSLRNGIVVERNAEGAPREARTALHRDGTVPLDADGKPVAVSLPDGFEPIEDAFPHALAATFDREAQRRLTFQPLPDAPSGYRLACPAGAPVRLEFLDRRAPRRRRTYGADARCDGRASGQMCVDPGSGEIHKMVLYALAPEAFSCVWDKDHPFSVVEQEVVEPGSGVRFPSAIATRGRWGKEAAVFRQTFTECKFFDVRSEVELHLPPPASGP
jgi:hypothetical protein